MCTVQLYSHVLFHVALNLVSGIDLIYFTRAARCNGLTAGPQVKTGFPIPYLGCPTINSFAIFLAHIFV